MYKKHLFIKEISFVTALLFVLGAERVSAQSGGPFTVTESVVASGGGQQTAGGTFSLDGTVGQAIAGNAASGSPFAVTSGFWNFTPSGPTAASVGVSGQVRTANGAGIQNAVITLVAQDGSARIARSSSFGYYRFGDVMAGETYFVSISTKRFSFSQPTIVVSVLDEIAGLDFIADPLP